MAQNPGSSIGSKYGLGGQPLAAAFARRLAFAVLISLTVIAMCTLMVATLSRGGFDFLDGILTACFLATLPWTVIGFWNAVIGLLILRLSADPVRSVCPVVIDPADDEAITARTALLMCVRNESAEAVSRNLRVMMEGLAAAGVSQRFHIHILSDSTWGEVIAAEEEAFGQLKDRWLGVMPITYRRREDNAGFKAGNIRDICERWGGNHDYALVLDADSLMSTKAILRMVRTMQTNPRLGILQSLIVGMPTTSPFARFFQFGMRLGMRSYTLGSAWWQGDCGPYWGHNALIRLKPFTEHCHLPKLPGRPPLGGWILSHDQVEAALMRRAGYEVRVLPDEEGSWEENPPTLLEFIRRDLRFVDVLASAKNTRAYGGAVTVTIGFLGEILFSALLAPVIALAHTLFMLGLPFGRAAVWSAQRRSNHRVPLAEGARRLWPQTLFGTSAVIWSGLAAPEPLAGFLPFLLGSVLAVPIAVATSNERLGLWLGRVGLWRIPDESAPAAELCALRLPALRRERPAVGPSEPVPEAAAGR